LREEFFRELGAFILAFGVVGLLLFAVVRIAGEVERKEF